MVDTRLLSGVEGLVAVIETGSFVRAAEALGLLDSGVSRAIARLEARVGVAPTFEILRLPLGEDAEQVDFHALFDGVRVDSHQIVNLMSQRDQLVEPDRLDVAMGDEMIGANDSRRSGGGVLQQFGAHKGQPTG